MSFYYQHPDAPQPNRPLRLGVVALIVRNDTLLLERRSDAGRWGLIGGAVEEAESLHSALVREVAEETGLVIQSYQLFGTFSDPTRIVQYPDGTIVRIVTLVYLVDVRPDITLVMSDESSALRFFTPAELVQLDIVETHRHIVDHYLAVEAQALPILE